MENTVTIPRIFLHPLPDHRLQHLVVALLLPLAASCVVRIENSLKSRYCHLHVGQGPPIPVEHDETPREPVASSSEKPKSTDKGKATDKKNTTDKSGDKSKASG
ncbi:unnamed protein product [Orchesella dallaii]|uniref:Secreted protein n=1 Tax=Orchesella dallaii TaxID=48710 RepID=A0ABP1RPM5_9HEXA